MYESIKNFITQRLGFPRVKVYMTSEQLDSCIWEAISWYYDFRDEVLKQAYISGIPGQSTYDIPPTIVPRFIREVIFKPSDPLLSLTGVMQDVYVLYYLQSSGGASSFIVDYWMTLASYEEYERVLGNQPHWELFNENQIKLDPIPSIDFTLGIRYSEIPSENVISNIRWIRLYSLACAKAIEGEIRSKFSSFSAGSGDISLNGDALKAEAEIEKERLLTENFERQYPLGMIIG